MHDRDRRTRADIGADLRNLDKAHGRIDRGSWIGASAAEINDGEPDLPRIDFFDKARRQGRRLRACGFLSAG